MIPLGRALAAVALLALSSLPVAVVATDDEGFPHVNPKDIVLPPGGRQAVELSFGESGEAPAGAPQGSFGTDWIFILNVRLGEGSPPVRIRLHPGHTERLGPAAADWNHTGAGTQVYTARLPVTDLYTLTFENPDPARNATLTFVYDQACNCAAKPIPVEVPGLTVIFNADVRKGATWKATFPEPAVHRLSIELAKRTNARSQWPHDFVVIARSDAASPGPDGRPSHELTWTADEDARYYFFTRSTAMDLRRFDPRDPASSVMVTPEFDQVAQARTTPDLGGALAAIALGGLAFAGGRRPDQGEARRRPAPPKE